MEDNGTYEPHDNVFEGCWVENLHPDTDQAILVFKGNSNRISGWQFFDCAKKTGATGTAFIRVAPPAVNNYGANVVDGKIMGRSTAATSIDYGVDVTQSSNLIHGTKGYRGNNVRLASCVAYTSIWLGGAESTATDAAVEDNSGVTTNYYFDAYLKTASFHPSAGPISLTSAAVTSATGVLSLGNGTQATVGTAGAATALPAQPTGYLKIYIGTTQYVIPYYAQA